MWSDEEDSFASEPASQQYDKRKRYDRDDNDRHVFIPEMWIRFDRMRIRIH